MGNQRYQNIYHQRRHGRVLFTMCQTDAEVQPSYRGISLILVEADREGLTAADVGDKMGIHMMATAEVNFKDVRVPATNIDR